MTQSEALDILKMGKNVFLTGPAGSGKTFVLNSYIQYLKSHAVNVAVTASTGIAATHLGGQTIHSWSGLGVKDTLTDYDIEELMQRQYLYKKNRKKDNTYLSILNQIRQNKVSEKTLELLKTRLNKDPESRGESTRLYTHNIDVDVVNKRYLDLLKTQTKNYHMTSKGSHGLSISLKKSCLSPESLELKIGARVMFTKNHPEGAYVNGTLGIVKEFNQYGDPVVLTNTGMSFSVLPQSWKIEEEGKVKAEISQLPLRLAWAITVHKSQGMSLDSMEVDLSKSFVRGMG